VQGAGSRAQGAGRRVQGSGFRVQGPGFRIQGAGSRVQGPAFRVQEVDPLCSGFRVHGAKLLRSSYFELEDRVRGLEVGRGG